MNDIQGYQNGPIETGASRAKEMSPRAYNLVMSALIFLGFCAMGAGAYFTSTMSFARMMMSGAALPLVFGSFILTIVGMVMMSAAAGKQSVGLSLVGYVIFASTFGLTASFGLANYDLPTINTAFIATAAITFVFGALGVTFPKFFQPVYGIGFGILLATILVEIVLMFMGVSQSITDLIVIVVFAGFIGYDTYVATTVPPTLPNAVLMASNLFVDIINVFLRILAVATSGELRRCLPCGQIDAKGGPSGPSFLYAAGYHGWEKPIAAATGKVATYGRRRQQEP